jgi:hypothetical protein
MNSHARVILSVGLFLTLSTVAAGQGTRGTKSRPASQPPKHSNVVLPRMTLSPVPKDPRNSIIPDSKPFLGGFAGSPVGGFGPSCGFAGNLGGIFGLGGGSGFGGNLGLSGGYGIGGGFAGNGIAGGLGGLGSGTGSYGQGLYGNSSNSSGNASGGSLGPVTSRLSADDRRRILEQQYRDRGSPQYGDLQEYYSDYDRMVDSSPWKLPDEVKLLGELFPPFKAMVTAFKVSDYAWRLESILVGRTPSGHVVNCTEMALQLAADLGVDGLFYGLKNPLKGLTNPLKEEGFGTVADVAKFFAKQEVKKGANQGAKALSEWIDQK